MNSQMYSKLSESISALNLVDDATKVAIRLDSGTVVKSLISLIIASSPFIDSKYSLAPLPCYNKHIESTCK